MYLPYADNDHRLYCVMKLTKNDNHTTFYEKQNYKGASLFINWAWRPMPSDVLNSRIGVIRSRETAVWDATLYDRTLFTRHY